MKDFNLENAWCRTTQENYNALVKLGYKSSDNIHNAFREDFETHLFIKDNIIKWGHKNCIGVIGNPNYWSKDREIHLVDGIFQYVMQTPKHKNNFKDYGFEADFEGEILKEVDGYYIGWIKPEGYNINACRWNKEGITNYECNVIKPIKKEWYEKEDNFRIAVKQIKSFSDYTDRDGNIYIMEKITDNKGMSSYNTNGYHTPLKWLECYRPATKEEVLSLLVKE